MYILCKYCIRRDKWSVQLKKTTAKYVVHLFSLSIVKKQAYLINSCILVTYLYF